MSRPDVLRDAVRLSADVYLPRASGRFPTILLRTPYESTRDGHIDWAAWWARRGYACVVEDNRGKFESEGVFYPYRDDGPDGHDTLAWIEPGVRPSMRFASTPTACTSPERWSMATTDGSESTMPRPRT